MTIMCKHQSSSGKRKLNYSYVVVGNQCDQNLELKMAQFSPKWPKKVAKAVFTFKEGFLRWHIKLPNIWANFVTDYVYKTFQK